MLQLELLRIRPCLYRSEYVLTPQKLLVKCANKIDDSLETTVMLQRDKAQSERTKFKLSVMRLLV